MVAQAPSRVDGRPGRLVNWSDTGRIGSAIAMTEVGAYEAKTHLAELLERVQRGERFVITKHGRPVAELVPTSVVDAQAVHRAIEEVAKARAWLQQRGHTLRSLLAPDETLRDLAHREHRF